MDQIVFLGMGETGFNIVETVASRAVSRKVRINGGARICCAKVYGEGQDLPENIGNALCCFGKSVNSALDTLEESSEMAVAVMIADLSELDVTLCTDTVVRIKEYFGEKGRRVKIKGIFILPDNGALSQVKDIFDTVLLATDQMEVGKIHPTREELLASLSVNIYTRHLTLLSERFDAEERDAELKADSKPLTGIIGYSKAVYPSESIAAYCAYRSGCDIIDKLNLAIDKEIYASVGDQPISKTSFRKEYVRLFEDKIESDPNGLFPQLKTNLMNEAVTLDADGEPQYAYSDKVEDFLLIIKNLIKVFASDRDLTDLESYSAGAAAELIKDINGISLEVANELLVNALPYSMSRINQKNDGSVFGMISHEGGEIPEDRIFLHPIVARYLIYRLSLRLDELKNNIDIAAETSALTEAFASGEKQSSAMAYLEKAVSVSFAKVLYDRLERFIGVIEEYFAALTDVRKHFTEGIDKNAVECVSNDPAMLFIAGSRIAKEAIYRSRLLCVEGQTPVTPTVFKLAVAQYCLGEDIFDTSNRPFIGKDPGYSFEYNAFTSYKKFFTRSNDPAVSVNFDLYTICGSEIAFRELVDRVRKAATPVGVSDVRYLWPISSVIADQCPALGEILGCDVEANKTRSAEKSMLECYTTAYGIDLGKFTK